MRFPGQQLFLQGILPLLSHQSVGIPVPEKVIYRSETPALYLSSSQDLLLLTQSQQVCFFIFREGLLGLFFPNIITQAAIIATENNTRNMV